MHLLKSINTKIDGIKMKLWHDAIEFISCAILTLIGLTMTMYDVIAALIRSPTP